MGNNEELVESLFSTLPNVAALEEKDVPLSQAQLVFAQHTPDQLKPSDILDSGVTDINLSVYQSDGEIKLYTPLCEGYSVGHENNAKEALSNIAQWMHEHPKEVVVLKLDVNLDEAGKKALGVLVNDTFTGSDVFTPQELADSFSGKWPSRNEIASAGKQLVLLPSDTIETPLTFSAAVTEGLTEHAIVGNVVPIEKMLHTDGADMLTNLPHELPFVSDLVKPAPNSTIIDSKTLKDNGVALLSKSTLTYVKESAKELAQSVDAVKKNPYIFIPTSLIAGAVVGDLLAKENAPGPLSKAALGKTVVNAILPTEGKIIFNSTASGVAAYQKYVDQILENSETLSGMDRISAIVHAIPPAVGSAIEASSDIATPVVASIAQLTPAATTATTSAVASFVQNMAAKFMAGMLIVKPATKTVQAALNVDPSVSYGEKGILERTKEGFIRGVEASLTPFFKIFSMLDFGEGKYTQSYLLDQSDVDSMIAVAAKRWTSVLNKHPELESDGQGQAALYQKMVEDGYANAIKGGIDEADMLPYPSFESVSEYISKNREGKNVASLKEKGGDKDKGREV